MTRKSRLILLLTCLFLFSLAAPAAVFYSQGYRFDWTRKKITQTGGIFLKAFPKQADIYLDGNFVKKTDFLFGSALLENLLPKPYRLRVEKEGYFVWEKTLEVRKKEVSEAKLITLIPNQNNFESLATNAEDFWVSSDGKKIILQETEIGSWSLKLYEPEKSLKSRLLTEREISQRGASLLGLEFAPDSREIYLSAGVKEQEKNFSLSLIGSSPSLKERKVTLPPDPALEIAKIDPDFPIRAETNYQLSFLGNLIFLSEDERLYSFDRETNSFEKTLDDVANLNVSPDKKKLAVLTDREIWIFFLEDASEQPVRKTGEKLFLIRLSQKIENLFWLNNGYLIFSAGNEIKIAEIDNRDKINIANIGQLANPKIFWDELNKKLYALSQGTLLRASF